MKNAYPLPARLAGAAALLLAASLAPTVALAAPPATVATCAGIKDAYPILGTSCETQYAKVNHAPANATDRVTSYRARIEVLKIFRKALLCNGIYGAGKPAQTRWSSAEDGHLQAVANLHVAMTGAGDPHVPALFAAGDLTSISMTKQQCK